MGLSDLIHILFSPLVFKGLILVCAPVAVFLFVWSVFPDEKQAAAKRRLGVVEESTQPQSSLLLRWLRPAYTAVASLLYGNLMPVGVQKWMEIQKPGIHKILIAADLRDEISPDEFFGFKVVMAFVSVFITGYVMTGLGQAPSPWTLLAMLGFGFFFPDLWIREKKNARKRSITKALPYAIDLVTLSVEAGLDFVSAIARLSQKTKPNALTKELDNLLREIRLGSSRSDALRSMSERLQIDEINSLTTLLIQADQLGSPIGQVLRAQSEQLRSRRFQSAEVAGAKASQMILFPLVFCVLPASVIILLGPTLLNFMKGGFF